MPAPDTVYVSLDNPTNDVGGFSHDKTATGLFRYNTGYLGPVGYVSAAGYYHLGGWVRFKLPLEYGDELQYAGLQLYSKGSTLVPSTASWILEMHVVAHDADNSPGPTTNTEADDYSSTYATTAYLDSVVLKYVSGSFFELGDLSTIINEIISRPGWSENNYICLMWRTKHPFNGTDSPLPNTEVGNWFSKYWIDIGVADGMTSANYPKLKLVYVPRPPGPAGQSVITDFEFTETISYDLPRGELSDTMTFEETIVSDHIRARGVEDTFIFHEDPNYLKNYYLDVVDVLSPTETIGRGHERTFAVDQTLAASQSITFSGPRYNTVVDQFVFVEEPDWTYTYNRDYEDTAVFTETCAANWYTFHVEDTLHMVETVVLDSQLQTYYPLSQTLSFVEELGYTGVFARGVDQTAPLSEAYNATLTYRGSAGGTTGVVNSGMNPTTDPVPPIGGGSGPGYVAPPAAQSTIPSVAQQMTLEWPVVSSTASVTIDPPLFNNLEEIQVERVQRTNRHNDTITFRDDTWVEGTTLRYKFQYLDPDKIDELIVFINATLGLKVKLTDHDGRIWHGFIVNTGAERGQYLRVCGETCEFDFDGELQ